MAHQNVLFGDMAELIVSYLDVRSLSCAEQAGLEPKAISASWCALVTSTAEAVDVCPWLVQELGVLPDLPKVALKQIIHARRTFSPVPADWKTMIVCPSPMRLHGILWKYLDSSSPRSPGVEHGRLEGDFQPEETAIAGGLSRPLVPPRFASVPLAVGTNLGRSMAVGVQMSTEVPGHNDEGCLFGIEMVGVLDGFGMSLSVCFAPFSGRCFIRYPENEMMVAQAMPPIEDILCDNARAWVYVSASGGVCFWRYVESEDSMQTSGEIPRVALPYWATEYFACISFQVDKLPAPAKASVTWAADNFPVSANAPVVDIDVDFIATWSIQHSH